MNISAKLAELEAELSVPTAYARNMIAAWDHAGPT